MLFLSTVDGRKHHQALTLVSAAAPAPCALVLPDISPPPQLTPDGTPPPLSPDGSTSCQSAVKTGGGGACVSRPTVSSPDLVKGHQPLDRFCWKMEILSVPSVSISILHDFAVFAPRGKLWRSISTVPTQRHKLSVICSYRRTLTWRMGLTHTEEVVGGEPLKVPDLQDEDGWELLLGFIQRENALPLPHHHYLNDRKKSV